MDLNAALTLFLEEYPNATEQPFAGNPVAEFVRRVVPEAIEAVIVTVTGILSEVVPVKETGSVSRGPQSLIDLSPIRRRTAITLCIS